MKEESYQENLALARDEDNTSLSKETLETIKEDYGNARKMYWDAIRLAFKFRQEVKFNPAAWVLPFAIAIAADLVDVIPTLGWIVSWFCAPFLFIFLWGKGRWKVRLGCYVLQTLEIIPLNIFLPDFFPLTILSMLWAYHATKKDSQFNQNMSEMFQREATDVMQGAKEMLAVHYEEYQNQQVEAPSANKTDQTLDYPKMI